MEFCFLSFVGTLLQLEPNCWERGVFDLFQKQTTCDPIVNGEKMKRTWYCISSVIRGKFFPSETISNI